MNNHQTLLHPFDLDLSNLSEIRKMILTAENDHTKNGMNTEDFIHLLVHKLNADSSYVHQLLRNYDHEYYKKIKWSDFLEYLEKESNLREKIIDWKLNDLKIKRFKELSIKNVKSSKDQFYSDKNTMIEKMIQFKIKEKDYYLVLFDNSHIVLFDENFNVAYILTLVLDKTQSEVFNHNDILDFREKKKDRPTSKGPANNANLYRSFRSRKISLFLSGANGAGAGGDSGGDGDGDGAGAGVSGNNINKIKDKARRSAPKQSQNNTLAGGNSTIESQQTRTTHDHNNNNRTHHVLPTESSDKEAGCTSGNKMINVVVDGIPRKNKGLNSIEKLKRTRNKLKLISYLNNNSSNSATINTSINNRKGQQDPNSIDKGNEIKMNKDVNMYLPEIPGEVRYEENDKKMIDKSFDYIFKKLPNERISESIGIINKKLVNKEYDDIKDIIKSNKLSYTLYKSNFSRLTRRQTVNPNLSPTKSQSVMVNNTSSIIPSSSNIIPNTNNNNNQTNSHITTLTTPTTITANPFSNYPNNLNNNNSNNNNSNNNTKQSTFNKGIDQCIPGRNIMDIKVLKDRIDDLNVVLDDLKNLNDEEFCIKKYNNNPKKINKDKETSKHMKYMHQHVPRNNSFYLESGNDINTSDKFNKLTTDKVLLHTTCMYFDQSRNLLILGLITREVEIFSPKFKYGVLVFDKLKKIKFHWVPIAISTGIHSLSHTLLLGILTERQLFIFRLMSNLPINNNTNKNKYEVDNTPFYIHDLDELCLEEPISLIFHMDFGIAIGDMQGKIQIFSEAKETKYITKATWIPKHKDKTISIAILKYCPHQKLFIIGDLKGGIYLFDAFTHNCIGNYARMDNGGTLVDLYFYDDEEQIIAIYNDKTILILDVSTMDIIQSLYDKDKHKPYNKLNACVFDSTTGVLGVAGSHIKFFQAEIDDEAEIQKNYVKTKHYFDPQTKLSEEITNIHDSFQYNKTFKTEENTLNKGSIDNRKKQILMGFFIPRNHIDRQYNSMLIVEENKLVKHIDIDKQKLVFSFIIQIEHQLAYVALSDNHKILAASNHKGIINLIYINSGEIYETLCLTNMKIELCNMIFCPKDIHAMIMAGDNEGRILLYNSGLKGKREKKEHVVMLSHEKPVIAMDTNSTITATADEGGLIIFWGGPTFLYRGSMRIPKEYDIKNCFESLDSTDAHETFTEKIRIIDVKFMKSVKYRNHLLVTENRGCLHIVKAIDTKIFQMHVINIGLYPVYDINDDDTRLFSLDIDMKIRIYIRYEDVDMNSFKAENSCLDDKICPVVFRKSSSKNVSTLASPIRPRKKNGATANSSTVYTFKLNDLNDSSTHNPIIGWAFLLVKEQSISNIPYQKQDEYKNILVKYIPQMTCYMTITNYGNIIFWTINGEVFKSIPNLGLDIEKTQARISEQDEKKSRQH